MRSRVSLATWTKRAGAARLDDVPRAIEQRDALVGVDAHHVDLLDAAVDRQSGCRRGRRQRNRQRNN